MIVRGYDRSETNARKADSKQPKTPLYQPQAGDIPDVFRQNPPPCLTKGVGSDKVDGWVDQGMHGWTNDGRMDVARDGWMMDEWMDGWIDGWLDG